MDEADYVARRANVEDLPALREIWAQERLDVEGLERRVTEFQVVCDAAGKIVGALGMRRLGEQGLIHNETIVDFGVADRLRRLLWDRLLTIAKNYAMARVWLADPSMFWKELGFDPADEESLKQLPAEFGQADGNWSAMMLRNDPFARGDAMAKQQELMFREALRAETEKTLQQAKVIKMVALLVSLGLFVIVCVGGYYIYKYQQRSGGYRPGSYRR